MADEKPPKVRVPLNLTEHPQGGIFLLLSQRGTPPPLKKATAAADAIAAALRAIGAPKVKTELYVYWCKDGRTIEVAGGAYSEGVYGDTVARVAPGKTCLGKTYEQWKALIGKSPVVIES